MPRLLPALAFATVVLVLTGGLLWYLAYDLGDEPPRQVRLPQLAHPARISWHEASATTIEAASWPDAMRALGYVHGQERSWSLLLWRQTALGALGSWFGTGVLDLDRLARLLGWASLAEASYDEVPEPDRILLEAYTEGLNAALRSRSTRFREELALLDLPIDPWEPWHTLALERLFAWLASPPAAPDSAIVSAETTALLAMDEGLRSWLHLFGFDFSYAWARSDSAHTYFVQRHVYGDTALPLYHDVRLRFPGRTVHAASLPGTPFFPAGRTDTHAWALLWSSTPHLRANHPATSSVRTRYERIRDADGSEALVQAFQEGATLYLTSTPPTPGDSLWVLTWPGLEPGTDLTAWRAVVEGSAPSFRLLRGDGLRVDPDGSWTILGNPAVSVLIHRGILVSNNAWSRPVAAHLDSMSQTQPGYLRSGAWQSDSYSRWAAELTNQLLARLEPLPAPSPLAADALTYLRNWDFRYTPASIAATILETWVATYQQHAGMLPSPADTTDLARTRYVQTLDLALDRLTEKHGPDLSLWRWERTAPRTCYYPVWSAADSRNLLGVPDAGDRFASMYLLGHGHPSALYWGSSMLSGSRPAPSTWESWISTASWGDWTTRDRHPDRRNALGRILATGTTASPLRMDSLKPVHVTLLESSPR